MQPVFRFAHTWRVSAPPDAAFDALAAVEQYPTWWPQIRGVERIDAESGTAHIRSLLPYALDLVITREIEDREGGILRVGLAGDLTGWSQFVVSANGVGTTADYRQEVVVSEPLMSRFARPLTPLLRANHRWMMRSGQRGLRRHLT